jgi:hypothetical protein
MTPHTQLQRHDPDNGILGDCYRTAIACLLDVPPSAVPHFYGDAQQTDQEVKGQMQEWLRRTHSLTIATVNFNDQLPIAEVVRYVGKWNPGLHYLFSGLSPRGTSHVVICRDGEIVHDPHPEATGIVSGYEGGVYVVEFLSPASLLASSIPPQAPDAHGGG